MTPKENHVSKRIPKKDRHWRQVSSAQSVANRHSWALEVQHPMKRRSSGPKGGGGKRRKGTRPKAQASANTETSGRSKTAAMRRSGSRHATGTAVAAPVSASKTATIPSVTASVSTVPASAPAPAAVPAPAAADEIDEQEAEESTFSAHVFAAYAVAAAWVMSVYTRLYSPLGGEERRWSCAWRTPLKRWRRVWVRAGRMGRSRVGSK